MVIALDPRAARDYIPVSDRDLPEDQQTVFSIRPMSNLDEIEIGVTGSGEDLGARARAILTAVRRCVVGWKGLRDSSGADVPCQRADGALTIAAAERIPAGVLLELFAEIMQREQVTRDEAGKS